MRRLSIRLRSVLAATVAILLALDRRRRGRRSARLATSAPVTRSHAPAARGRGRAAERLRAGAADDAGCARLAAVGRRNCRSRSSTGTGRIVARSLSLGGRVLPHGASSVRRSRAVRSGYGTRGWEPSIGAPLRRAARRGRWAGRRRSRHRRGLDARSARDAREPAPLRGRRRARGAAPWARPRSRC